nr:MAG TPA: RNA-directed RNA polymerase L [Caudoviricetes sp.]
MTGSKGTLETECLFRALNMALKPFANLSLRRTLKQALACRWHHD